MSLLHLSGLARTENEWLGRRKPIFRAILGHRVGWSGHPLASYEVDSRNSCLEKHGTASIEVSSTKLLALCTSTDRQTMTEYCRTRPGRAWRFLGCKMELWPGFYGLALVVRSYESKWIIRWRSTKRRSLSGYTIDADTRKTNNNLRDGPILIVLDPDRSIELPGRTSPEVPENEIDVRVSRLIVWSHYIDQQLYKSHVLTNTLSTRSNLHST